MRVDPFWLHDRVLPSDANDPQEVARLGRALSDVGEDPGDLSRPAVTAAARRFQQSRGLKVDGVVQVNGPTVQRIAAERHERQTATRPSRPQRALWTQQAVPVRDSVGAGGRNRAEDRASIMRGLALGGYFSRFGALNPLKLVAGAEDPELERALERFRSKHGIRETGPLLPGSESLAILNRITAPRLHAFLKVDPTSSPQPPEKVVVIRNRPDSPTARSAPFRDEAQVSHAAGQDREIATRQARHVRREMDAVERGETAPPPSPSPEPVAQALKDDPALNDMTARQLDRIREIAAEEDLNLMQSETRTRLVRYMRQHEPDFLTALEQRYRDGEISQRQLERQAEMQTRRLSTHGTTPVAVARQDATLQVLKQAMLDEGADAREALARVEALMESNGQGDDGLPLLLEFIPGAGELVAATEAARHLAEARAAERDGNTAEANAAWTAFAVAVGGAVPVLGKAVKLLRHVNVVRKAQDAVAAQRARKEIVKREKDFQQPFESKSARELFGDEAWGKIDPKTRAVLEQSFSRVKGEQGEAYFRQLIDRAALEAPLKGTSHQRRVRIVDADGIPRTRHFDEITTEDIRPALFGLIVRRTKNGNGTAFEFKVGSSHLSRNQKAVDDMIKGGDKASSHLSKKATQQGLKLPEEVHSVHQLRIPIDALPRDELISAMRSALAEKGIPRHVIDDFERKFDTAYGLNRTLRANGLDDLADEVTIIRALGVDESSDET